MGVKLGRSHWGRYVGWGCLRIGCWGYLGARGTRGVEKSTSEKLNDLYCSPNIIRVIKSRRMGWAGHVACMGNKRVHTRFWWGNLMEKNTLVIPRRRWKDNIKTDLYEVGWGSTDRSGSGQGQLAGTCECGNEPLGFTKFGKFLDKLRTG
jgi:hypothetical protein